MPEAIPTIPIQAIAPNPLQPRRHFDENELRALAESIEAQGLIQPIKIAPDGNGGYVLVDDGERRLRAMRDILGWTELEVGRHVVVVEDGLPDADRLARAVAANLQRQDLNPIESARALQQLHDMGLSDADIARRLGKSRAWVTNRRRLLQLPPAAREAVAAGTLAERKARELLRALRYVQPKNDQELDRWIKGMAGAGDPKGWVDNLLWERGRKRPILWPPEWKGPDGRKCRDCPLFLDTELWGHKMRACMALQRAERVCYRDRRAAWERHELARVSAETGIPVATEEDEVHFPTTYEQRALLRRLLAQTPPHPGLRLAHVSGLAPAPPLIPAPGVQVGVVNDPSILETRGLDWDQTQEVERAARWFQKHRLRPVIEAFIAEREIPAWLAGVLPRLFHPHWDEEETEAQIPDAPAALVHAVLNVVRPFMPFFKTRRFSTQESYWQALLERMYRKLIRLLPEMELPPRPTWAEIVEAMAEMQEAEATR